ncbi:MAG: PIG-L family deacetylase [Verrucomicrobiales bacterium]|nr:PIG-L family deacetylase [bacterium]MDF2377927.1 PIG-L family deacetylase [Verrucomicrobiales bacterium]
MKNVSLSKTVILTACLVSFVCHGRAQEVAEDPAFKPLRIIAFGAHPDDPEFQIGGCAIKWTKLGHKVKLVSCTNGDIGHWEMSGGELAKRRTAEVEEAARRMGTEVEVLDIHDGELLPTLENRKTIVRLIREWDADLVFSHRPYDYHPDHRNVGLLVQDAAFMVMVPNFCPDTPSMRKNPAFFFFPDSFTKPYPFTPTLSVSIDDVLEEKVKALDALESQVYEGGALGNSETRTKRFGDDPVRRVNFLLKSWSNRHERIADKHRESIIEWYGKEQGNAVKHAEAFELCEYGSKPSKDQLRRLFPFFPEAPGN